MPIVCYTREEVLNMVDAQGIEPLFLARSEDGIYNINLAEIEDQSLRTAVSNLRGSVEIIDEILNGYAAELGR